MFENKAVTQFICSSHISQSANLQLRRTKEIVIGGIKSLQNKEMSHLMKKTISISIFRNVSEQYKCLCLFKYIHK